MQLATTLLDVLGLLAIAAGVTFGLWVLVGPVALVAGGIVILTGSNLAVYLAKRAGGAS